jgi:hypothetical protein
MTCLHISIFDMLKLVYNCAADSQEKVSKCVRECYTRGCQLLSISVNPYTLLSVFVHFMNYSDYKTCSGKGLQDWHTH